MVKLLSLAIIELARLNTGDARIANRGIGRGSRGSEAKAPARSNFDGPSSPKRNFPPPIVRQMTSSLLHYLKSTRFKAALSR